MQFEYPARDVFGVVAIGQDLSFIALDTHSPLGAMRQKYVCYVLKCPSLPEAKKATKALRRFIVQQALERAHLTLKRGATAVDSTYESSRDVGVGGAQPASEPFKYTSVEDVPAEQVVDVQDLVGVIGEGSCGGTKACC